MTVRIFVSASAAVLAAWLGVTYLRDVPSDHYPDLGNTVAVEETTETLVEEISIELDPQVAQAPTH